jgi:hypothetical protein
MTHFATPVTRLNERDEMLVNLDAIDCYEPIVPLGSLLHLRGGHVLRVVESVDELKQRLIEAEVLE